MTGFAHPGSKPLHQRTRAILEDKTQPIIAQRGRIVGIVAVVDKPVPLAVEPVEPAGIEADPERPFAVYVKRVDIATTETMRIIRIVSEMGKAVGASVSLVEAPARADPQRTGPIFVNCPDRVVAQAAGVVGVVRIGAVPVLGSIRLSPRKVPTQSFPSRSSCRARIQL